ncbi:sugar phosphate nucleotidyltransferase [Natronobiforma cellulositropha]|uniref:sugar phosphate nucleotidyltransferase n=1 Tax=Natronobiforma cellulositropha TaxID=1679076 RepID=UPI0021D58FEC|nr:sugar phosphate nucleotidyltransferase [Natronobiforma cellulositropha]
MKAVIPAAGQGTRLFPHTHTKPKAMVRLAGQPILGHILESLAETDISEVIVIVGTSMQTQILEYALDAYGEVFEFTFVEQASAEGLGHSIYQAREAIDGEPILITLGDMLFENGHARFLEIHRQDDAHDGSIGVKRVVEPSHYGVVEVDGDDVVNLVEKPDDPPSDLAISGVYVVERTDALMDALGHLIENDLRGAGGEFQLTDALQRIIDDGVTLRTFEVDEWYDCGRPETLLEANRVLLSRDSQTSDETCDNSVIIPPVDFGRGVTVTGSIVGPNVSIDDGTHVETSIVTDSIIGEAASIEQINLTESIVGDFAEVCGQPTNLNLGDNSSINL